MSAHVGPEAVVDLAAYRTNLLTVATTVAPAEVMAVVKDDAYGHGLVEVARAATAAGVRWLGVLDVPTGIELREAGIFDEIALFAWLLRPDEDYRIAIEAGIDLGVSTFRQLDGIVAAESKTRARVHLKIDTGLHRDGASAGDWPALVARAVELQEAEVLELVGVWTHIAEASDEEDTLAIQRFHSAIGVAQGLGAAFQERHLAASAASFARPDARFDMVRIGAFSYGIAPGGGIGPAQLGLIPVMTVSAPVVSVVGGFAVVDIGYGDGISSASAGAVDVTIGGVRYPIVAIGVETLRVEIGDAPVVVGERAVLFGSGMLGEPTLQEWADATGTIGEEIVTRLSERVPRRYVG